jgi:hypothetical protein
MSWSPFWRLVELEYLGRGITYSFDDIIEAEPRLEPHLIGAMAHWLWQYDVSASPMPRSGGRLLWKDCVDENLSYKYTEMAAYMGAYATEYPETVRPTIDMLYRMGGHPRTEPAATAVETLAKLAAAGIADMESLLGELAMVLDQATPQRQLVGTHGVITLKLLADIALEPFADRFRAMLVADPARRHVHSRQTIRIGGVTATARKLHAVEALALIEATEAVSIFDRFRDVSQLVKQQDWADLAALAIATVAAPELIPEPAPSDVTIPAEEMSPHGIWHPVRAAIIEHADTGSREFRIAAGVLFTLLSGNDPDDIDLQQVAADSNDVASLLNQESDSCTHRDHHKLTTND